MEYIHKTESVEIRIIGDVEVVYEFEQEPVINKSLFSNFIPLEFWKSKVIKIDEAPTIGFGNSIVNPSFNYWNPSPNSGTINGINNGLYVYSFASNPNIYQPSGSLNVSYIHPQSFLNISLPGMNNNL